MPDADVTLLRRRALSHSLFRATTLSDAVERLGFVQADPIRAPARAQDLILRQRVDGYRAGDLERVYADLGIEEGYMYLYGFFPRAMWELVHPRASRAIVAFERKVLHHLEGRGAVHPSELGATFGQRRVANDWGGRSKATTRALDRLHHFGMLRVARRDRGIRVYETVPTTPVSLTKAERLRRLMIVFANLLAPVSETTLSKILLRLKRSIGPAKDVTIRALHDRGELEMTSIAGRKYFWPDGAFGSDTAFDDDDRVRILAPFDPVVWDRARFEVLWGWEYRFEAYVPVAKRVRGYYAMPVLWRDQMIGWANAAVVDSRLHVEFGYVAARPKGRAFASALEAEIESMRIFLNG